MSGPIEWPGPHGQPRLSVSRVHCFLPQLPTPLLWLGTSPPDPKINDAGYQICRFRGGDEWPEQGASYSWIYLSEQILGEKPLNTLSRLSDFAGERAVLVTERTEEDQLPAAESAWRSSHMASLLGRMGWEQTEAGDRITVFRWLGSEPRYRVSVPSSNDREECLGLFERAFGEPPNPDVWEWKYGEGRGFSTVVRRDGHLVAHYGGVSRRIRFLGAPARAVQICDVGVDPAERAVMTKKGAFTSVAAAYQLNIFGLDDRHVCGFGFPNHRHVVLGERSGFYAEVETLVEFNWDCRRYWPSIATTARLVRVAEKESLISSLWFAMARDLAEAILVERDVPYLQYRYESRPGVDYRIFLVKRRWGIPLGLVVLRFDGDLCRLIDVVGPVANLRRLVQSARQIAGNAGCLKLVMWITSGKAHLFRSVDAKVQPLDIKIPGNCFVKRVPVETLKKRWWLMMGDTDFL